MALLEVEGATVQFGGLTAVSDVSFTVEPGTVRALIGPNGAGKTTLFRAIARDEQLSRGSVRFRGEPIHQLTPNEVSRRGVRRTFQNGGLFGDLTALENVLTGLHIEIDSSLLGLVVGSKRSRASERAATRRARELLEMMGIGHVADQFARDLSGGQQRMVEIVRALATDPPLLLLDEPAVGLAPPVRLELLEIIRRLVETRGTAVLLIEHAIEFVMTVSDSIMVLNNGTLIAEGTPDEVRQNREVLEAYLGR
ncbi:MAG: ABC transporter ATP-binding protein [Ectothiorhodospiraceae bacterium]|nr:ABC transporter ATP-binding protein [Chromatiales bacterium]MCP5155699.1 ABC transporter ATP-binding protein [Ectothiorhodospiraceae bacterium]